MKSKFGVGALVVSLFLAVGVMASPTADAQPAYEGLQWAPAGQSCPAGFTQVSSNAVVKWCHPDGYSRVITSQAECASTGVTDSTLPCWWNAYGLGAGDTCLAPGAERIFQGARVCAGQVFGLGGVSGISEQLQPVCIEDDLVQNNPAAAGLSVGDTFIGDKSVQYLIHTGGPSCSFNCHAGFDVNCDGKLGDYCSVELDRKKVKDAGICLAAMSES